MANLSILDRADGSASYSSNGYSVIAAVNGPVEVQRKDEIPEEAAIDVVLRPAVGVGGVRERHLEALVKKALRQMILVSAHPRTLIQVTLQVVAMPAETTGCNGSHQSASNLPLLPALLQSSMLALMSTSLPLNMSLTSTLIAVSPSGGLTREPDAAAVKEALSIHAFGFSSHGKLIVAESEGAFQFEVWEQAYDRAVHICRGPNTASPDGTGNINMEPSEPHSLEDMLRNTIEEKTAREQRWMEAVT